MLATFSCLLTETRRFHVHWEQIPFFLLIMLLSFLVLSHLLTHAPQSRSQPELDASSHRKGGQGITEIISELPQDLLRLKWTLNEQPREQSSPCRFLPVMF